MSTEIVLLQLKRDVYSQEADYYFKGKMKDAMLWVERLHPHWQGSFDYSTLTQSFMRSS